MHHYFFKELELRLVGTGRIGTIKEDAVISPTGVKDKKLKDMDYSSIENENMEAIASPHLVRQTRNKNNSIVSLERSIEKENGVTTKNNKESKKKGGKSYLKIKGNSKSTQRKIKTKISEENMVYDKLGF